MFVCTQKGISIALLRTALTQSLRHLVLSLTLNQPSLLTCSAWPALGSSWESTPPAPSTGASWRTPIKITKTLIITLTYNGELFPWTCWPAGQCLWLPGCAWSPPRTCIASPCCTGSPGMRLFKELIIAIKMHCGFIIGLHHPDFAASKRKICQNSVQARIVVKNGQSSTPGHRVPK